MGEEKPRTVVSGLVRFVPIEQVRNNCFFEFPDWYDPFQLNGLTSITFATFSDERSTRRLSMQFEAGKIARSRVPSDGYVCVNIGKGGNNGSG